MRRTLAMVLVMSAGVALAGWHTMPTGAGVATDVYAYDAGLFTVATSTAAQAWVAQPDGGAVMLAQVGPGNFVGAGLFDGGCLAGLVGNQVQFSSATCGTAVTVASLGSTQATAFFRVSPGGRAWIVANNPAQVLRVWESAPAANAAYSIVLANALIGSSGDLISTSSAEVGFLVGNTNALLVSYDGGASAQLALSKVPGAMSAFEASAGAISALLINTDGTMDLLPALGAGVAPVAVALPAGALPISVSFSNRLGDAAGTGFGLAVTATGSFLSPIPDPAHPAATWVQRAGAPTALAARVHCVDPRFCVTTGAGTSVNVYFNEFTPTASLSVVWVDGGQAVLVADAGDLDGDPVFVTWSSGLPLASGVSPSGSDVLVSLPQTCAYSPVTATLSDGWAAHVTTTVPIDVGGLVLPAPDVQPPALVVAAGSGPQQITADGGCSNVSFLWTGAASGTSDGGTFTWAVPATWCSADAGVLVEQVQMVSSISTSPQTTVALTVLPWGPADVPQFSAGATQRAGTSQLWNPTDPGHACASTPLFPGTVLSWSNLASGVPGAVLDAGVGGLWVQTVDECVGGQIDADAFRAVDGGWWVGAVGPGHFAVTVQVVLDPLDAGTSFSIGTPLVDAAAATASGTFTTNASCPDLRALGATIEVRQDGGVVLQAVTFPTLSQGWQVGPIPGGCSGGVFTAVATLTIDGGTPTTFISQADIPLTGASVVATGVSPATLPVACGAGLQGPLTVELGSGSCSAVGYTWTQTSGPALEPLLLDGGSALVQSVSRGFETLGQTLTFDVALDAGFGNVAQVSHTVTVVAEPFIAMVGEVHPAPLREEESSQVRVTFSNTTSCPVHGVEARIALADLAPVPGTVQLDGVPIDDVTSDALVVVPGLTLDGDQVRRLQFRARPKLLARPVVTPSAWVGELEVSLAAPVVARPSACGCGGTPGLALVALAAILFLRRRHR